MTIDTEKLFQWGMRWRILYGALRIFLGLAVLQVVGKSLSEVFTSLMSYELVEDPHDFLYEFIRHTLEVHPVHISYFVAVYLIFWGVMDMVLSYNLIKHRLWAFPASLVLIGFFVLYELVRFSHTHSLILLSVIAIDAIIFWLVHREYGRLKLRQVRTAEGLESDVCSD